MGLLNLKPARSQAEPVEIIADLDAIIAKKVGFTLHGKKYVIHPISTERFLILSQKIAKLAALSKVSSGDMRPVFEAYSELITEAVEGITKKEVMDMTQAQTAALVQLIYDCIQGRTEKKKDLVEQNPPTNPLPA